MTHDEIDAMPAGAEMDVAVARAIGAVEGRDFAIGLLSGSVLPMDNRMLLCTSGQAEWWSPSTDLNAAVEACVDCWWWRVSWQEGFSCEAEVEAATGSGSATGETAALALCRALLKATLPEDNPCPKL